jgi:hypothetical protein
MTDRSYYAQVENDIRAQLSMAIQVMRPYAQSSGSFNDWQDLRHAIRLARQYIERAELLADHKLPPTS